MRIDIISKLRRVGFTQNEAKVYLALLELGPTTTKPLIDKAGIHTSKVYEALERLVQKGLVNFVTEANRKKFQATDPQSIIFFLEEKEAGLKKEKKFVGKLLPSLRSLRKPPPHQGATIFQGLGGYKALLNNMLVEIGKGGHYDVFASGMMKKGVGPHWYQFQTKKKKLGIKSRCIWDEKVRSKKEYLKEYHGKGRFIPSSSYQSPVDIFVYNDKVLLVSYGAEPLFAVLIHSRGMAKGYASLFNSLWKIGKS